MEKFLDKSGRIMYTSRKLLRGHSRLGGYPLLIVGKLIVKARWLVGKTLLFLISVLKSDQERSKLGSPEASVLSPGSYKLSV